MHEEVNYLTQGHITNMWPLASGILKINCFAKTNNNNKNS